MRQEKHEIHQANENSPVSAGSTKHVNKNIMKNCFYLLFLGYGLLSCESGGQTGDNTEAQTSQNVRAEGPLKEYLELKDALVESNAAEAKTEAAELQQALTALSVKNSDAIKAAGEHAGHIAATDDLEEQRRFFAPLSESIISLAKSGALGRDELYVQHCPMAMNNKGADWLSDEEQIRNPYFGEKMMKCGSVKEEIK